MLQTYPKLSVPRKLNNHLRRKSMTNISKSFSTSSFFPVWNVFNSTQPDYSSSLNAGSLPMLLAVTWMKSPTSMRTLVISRHTLLGTETVFPTLLKCSHVWLLRLWTESLCSYDTKATSSQKSWNITGRRDLQVSYFLPWGYKKEWDNLKILVMVHENKLLICAYA